MLKLIPSYSIKCNILLAEIVKCIFRLLLIKFCHCYVSRTNLILK